MLVRALSDVWSACAVCVNRTRFLSMARSARTLTSVLGPAFTIFDYNLTSRCTPRSEDRVRGHRVTAGRGISARAVPGLLYPGGYVQAHRSEAFLVETRPSRMHPDASRINRARSDPFSCVQAPVPRPSGHVPSPFGGRGVWANALLLDERVEQHTANANGASEQLNGLQRLA